MLSADVLYVTFEGEKEAMFRLSNTTEMNSVLQHVREIHSWKSSDMQQKSLIFRYDIANRANLRYAIVTEGCRALHICCHGMDLDYEETGSKPKVFERIAVGKEKYLVLEGLTKAYDGIKPKHLQAFFEDVRKNATDFRRCPSLVFLACCHGEAIGQMLVGKSEGRVWRDQTGSYLPSTWDYDVDVPGHVRHVICSRANEELCDEPAVVFMRIFYGALFHGHGVKDAFDLAKKGLVKDGLPDEKEQSKYLHLYNREVRDEAKQNERLFENMTDGKLEVRLPPWHDSPFCSLPAVERSELPKDKQVFVADLALRLLQHKFVILHGPAQTGKWTLVKHVCRRWWERGALNVPALAAAYMLELEHAASFRHAGHALMETNFLSSPAVDSDDSFVTKIQARLDSKEWTGKQLFLVLRGSGMDVGMYRPIIRKLASDTSVRVMVSVWQYCRTYSLCLALSCASACSV
jgi:hypothetical protein